jgi:glycine/D-amino acid oxidase-like deaminating enzyme
MREADVIVVGGGIVGAASAYYLAKDGAKVALFEKGTIAGRIVADVTLKGHAALDIAPFKLGRFADGTSLGPRPVI